MLSCRLDLAARFLDFGRNEMSDTEIGQCGAHLAELYGFAQQTYRFGALPFGISGSGHGAVSRQLTQAIPRVVFFDRSFGMNFGA